VSVFSGGYDGDIWRSRWILAYHVRNYYWVFYFGCNTKPMNKTTLQDLIEQRDKLIEDSIEYNDLTEEIQLIQNDMITIDIMEDY